MIELCLVIALSTILIMVLQKKPVFFRSSGGDKEYQIGFGDMSESDCDDDEAEI